MYDLIVLGGGPAGLTAAIYALRKRLNVLLVSRDLGGKINYRLQLPEVEHHLVITGEEVVNRFANEVGYLDFMRLMERVESVQRLPGGGFGVRTRGGKEIAARALVVALGARARRLDVPGEKEFLMRGLCYSALSYAQLFVDRVTAVVGDSQLALRGAAELAQIAKRVTLIAPTHGELDSPLGRRLQQTENLVILEGYRVERVFGDNYARGLVITRPNNGEPREITADGIFVELGLVPNSGAVSEWVECDAGGRIKVDIHGRTSVPGVFAAGDVTNTYAEQVLVAIGEGAKAALSAYEYLLGQPVESQALAGEWR